MKLFSRIRALIMLPLWLICLLVGPRAQSTPGVELVSQDLVVLGEAFTAGQGITTDGEYYYTSGAITAINTTALAKRTLDGMTTVKVRLNHLPDKCRERGNNHIGGISAYNGKIYASVEGGGECEACIVVFDCNTLEPTGEIYDLPNELYGDGIPWLAVDGNTGLLYASGWSHKKEIRVYDVNDGMRFVKEITVTGMEDIHRIQGGEFYNGTLYLSSDTGEERDGKWTKNILSVNVETGETKIAFERNVGRDKVEAEGLTFLATEDGANMHVLDYDKLIGLYVHHYKVDV